MLGLALRPEAGFCPCGKLKENSKSTALSTWHGGLSGAAMSNLLSLQCTGAGGGGQDAQARSSPLTGQGLLTGWRWGAAAGSKASAALNFSLCKRAISLLEVGAAVWKWPATRFPMLSVAGQEQVPGHSCDSRQPPSRAAGSEVQASDAPGHHAAGS